MEKTLLFILVVLFAFAALQGQVTAKFKYDRHDFGKIDKRTKEFVETTFKITNVGEKPLLIYKVDISCGCVSPDFTKKPIKYLDLPHRAEKWDGGNQLSCGKIYWR